MGLSFKVEVAAIGRIPVVSASGQPLMPCKYSKAKTLLAAGKAVICQAEDGRLYLRLKFDPESPLHSPPKSSCYYVKSKRERKAEQKKGEDNGCAVANENGEEEREETGIWSVIEPDRLSLARLIRRVFRDRICRRIAGLTFNERMYLKALFEAQWSRLKSRLVLRVLAPIVEKMLRALGRRFEGSALNYEGAYDKDVVKGALSIMSRSAFNLVKNVASRICNIAKKLGNRLADNWRKDPAFIKYLMVLVLPQNRNPLPPFSINL